MKIIKHFLALLIISSAASASTPSVETGIGFSRSIERPATFAPIVKIASPAVVNISTTQKIEVKNSLDDFRFDFPDGAQFDFFKEFLDREFGDGESGRTKKAHSLGSGFLIDPEGYIVTNNHVIAEADEINISLSDDAEKTYKAKIIGKDPKTDLALIKIEPNKDQHFPYLKFGDSDISQVGDWIIAVGNPFGLGGTVTAGIISAKARIIPGQLDEFIQTDASINRGNSGGPMINMDGEVIGVNSVIISPSGGNVGIGFSIPANQIKPIISQLREKGSIARGWLGVKIQSVSEDIAKNLGLTEVKGALVSEVTKDSPADKAGIKVGDIITKFDGQVVNNMQKLPRLVAETAISKVVKIDLIRDLKNIVLEAKILQPEQDIALQADANSDKKSKDDSDSSSYIIGMKLEAINSSNRTKYRIDQSMTGVVVTKVDRNSIARDAGIKAGDAILKFNRLKIETPNDLKKAIESAKAAGSKNGVFLIHRDDSTFFIVLDLE